MLEEKIFNDYKEAMKSKDTLKSAALSFLRAEMLNVAIAKKKKGLDDSEVISVIRKQAKGRQEAIEQFKKGNRQDLVDKETRELEILKGYLPPELSQEEIRKVIEEAVAETGAQGMKDMGKVMVQAMPKLKGRADGSQVSRMVRDLLEKNN